MNRRKFLAAAVAVVPFVNCPRFLAAADNTDVAPASLGWRCFEITTRVTLPATAGAAQLWLPLAQTAGGYQSVLDLHWQGNGQTRRIHDARYGAPLLHAAWEIQSGGTAPQIEVVQTVATRDRTASPFLPLTLAERQFWTAAPADGAVLETDRRIVAGQTENRAKLRAFYDWVVDHTHRDPDTPGCGTGDYQSALSIGHLGGKCADINALMVGLARAAGFPAREVYGLRVVGSSLSPCLGRRGDVSRAQHCRAEVFLEDDGWFPPRPGGRAQGNTRRQSAVRQRKGTDIARPVFRLVGNELDRLQQRLPYRIARRGWSAKA